MASGPWRGPLAGLLVFGGVVAGLAYAFRAPGPTAPPLTIPASGSPSVRTHPAPPPTIPLTVLPVDSARVAPRPSAAPPSPSCPPGTEWTNFVEPLGLKRTLKGCIHPSDGGEAVREGSWTVADVSGYVSEGQYLNGQKHGRWVIWFPNGTAARTEEFKNGHSDGVFVEWSAAGQRLAEISYKDDYRDGPTTIWSEDGSVRRELWVRGRRVDPPEVDGGP